MLISLCALAIGSSHLKDDIRYASLNEVIGVLECVKQEFYRKKVVPYEKRKIKENSDVY